MSQARPDGLDAALLTRLARLGVSLGPPPEGLPAAQSANSAGADPAVVPLETAVPGRLEHFGPTACYVSDAWRAESDLHGGEALQAGREACATSLARLAGLRDLTGAHLATAVYLDIETTGLSAGAGTYAFLVGAGRFQGGAFVVRQFFMRDPSDEPAQMAALRDWLGTASCLVTFNGRAFDVPLLATRMRLTGSRWPLTESVHLDLLHSARRLWRRRLASCSLISLERHVLGLNRHEDVPGWMIPERYWAYQRTGDARGLVGIFQHNLLDVTSMVALVSRLARTYRQPGQAVQDGLDWVSLARLYETNLEGDRALDAWRAALAAGLPKPHAVDARLRYAATAKRLGRWDVAVAEWQSLVSDREHSPAPYIELAKYLEHRSRDWTAARDVVAAARSLVATGRLARGRQRATLAELDHRLARLERKLSKIQPAPQG